MSTNLNHLGYRKREEMFDNPNIVFCLKDPNIMLYTQETERDFTFKNGKMIFESQGRANVESYTARVLYQRIIDIFIERGYDGKLTAKMEELYCEEISNIKGTPFYKEYYILSADTAEAAIRAREIAKELEIPFIERKAISKFFEVYYSLCIDGIIIDIDKPRKDSWLGTVISGPSIETFWKTYNLF